MNFSSDSIGCKSSVPIFGWFSFCSVTTCHGVNSSHSCHMSRFSKLWHMILQIFLRDFCNLLHSLLSTRQHHRIKCIDIFISYWHGQTTGAMVVFLKFSTLWKCLCVLSEPSWLASTSTVICHLTIHKFS
jgi:hypothetical protein